MTKAELKEKFKSGAIPTQTDFANLIDFIPDAHAGENQILVHRSEDEFNGIAIIDIARLIVPYGAGYLIVAPKIVLIGKPTTETATDCMTYFLSSGADSEDIDNILRSSPLTYDMVLSMINSYYKELIIQ